MIWRIPVRLRLVEPSLDLYVGEKYLKGGASEPCGIRTNYSCSLTGRPVWKIRVSPVRLPNENRSRHADLELFNVMSGIGGGPYFYRHSEKEAEQSEALWDRNPTNRVWGDKYSGEAVESVARRESASTLTGLVGRTKEVPVKITVVVIVDV